MGFFSPKERVKPVSNDGFIISREDCVLVTGAAGFVGSRVVQALLDYGFSNVRCLLRPGSDRHVVAKVLGSRSKAAHVEILTGNLLSPEDCSKAVAGAAVIMHLAAGTGTKSFSD